MKIALFGGSFDPVHLEHVRLVSAAVQALQADKVIIIPAAVSPFKGAGTLASGEERLEMCRIAFRNLPNTEVSGFEVASGGVSFTYLTCRHFSEKYPNDELYLLLGADALLGFPKWKQPEEILRCVTLCACGRGRVTAERAAADIENTFRAKVILLPHTGEEVSSTRIRTELFFGRKPQTVDGEVYAFLRERGLYTHPAVLPALALEKQSRREHSFRVAALAAELAPRYGISTEKALLASALHDCGKYVPPDSSLLAGFPAPQDVPPPVLHQYTGAYLAEHAFGVKDEEVLDAVRYHTSGKENMTPLGKLVYLADLLEEERNFEGIERLREAFRTDLDECFMLALRQQVAYLKADGKEIYPLTERAYEWAQK